MTSLNKRNDRSLATSIINPLERVIFSINASDPSTFDHTSGKLQFAEVADDPDLPATTIIEVPARTGISVDNIATQGATFVYFDINGDIVQEDNLQGGGFLRDHVGGTNLIHTDNTIIQVSTNFTPVNLSNIAMGFADMAFTLGNLSGSQGNRNKVSGAANLKINKADGTFYYHSIYSRISNKSPNIWPSDEIIEQDLFVAFQTSDNTAGKFVLRPAGIQAGVYDDGTAVFADNEPQGTYGDEQWVNHFVIFIVDAQQLVVQYGTTVHETALEARLAVFTDDFDTVNILDGTVRLATITMRGGATDLSNTQHAQFRQALSATADYV